ncbi:EKC/KEOPS complex subunit TPRKB-like [Liolophura sinensis]|uniref:EKC/KEOPS complex subunit TPRKB-like n=1 Tax=Liolophura sinensis TaxID=3198878 RepID=UPI003158D59D
MAKTVCSRFHADYSVCVALISDVHDARELRKSVMSGKFEATLLNPEMILDEFQILVAANQAINLHVLNKMVTKSLHSEILYRLSPSKNISDSFKKFGTGENDKAVCVVIVNDKNKSTLDLILNISQGKLTDLEKLANLTDMDKVKKIYKLTDEELSQSPMLDAIVSRIASKDIVTI